MKRIPALMIVALMLAGCGTTRTVTVWDPTPVAASKPHTPVKTPDPPAHHAAAVKRPSVAEECRKLIPTENPNAPDTTQAGCEYSLRLAKEPRHKTATPPAPAPPTPSVCDRSTAEGDANREAVENGEPEPCPLVAPHRTLAEIQATQEAEHESRRLEAREQECLASSGVAGC